MIKEDITSIWAQKGYTLLMGLFGLGGFGTLIYYSAYYTTAVKIGIIQGAMPAIVLIGSCWIFKTSVNFFQIIGVALSLTGVIFIITKADINLIREFYRTLGFYFVKIDAQVERLKKNKINICLLYTSDAADE